MLGLHQVVDVLFDPVNREVAVVGKEPLSLLCPNRVLFRVREKRKQDVGRNLLHKMVQGGVYVFLVGVLACVLCSGHPLTSSKVYRDLAAGRNPVQPASEKLWNTNSLTLQAFGVDRTRTRPAIRRRRG